MFFEKLNNSAISDSFAEVTNVSNKDHDLEEVEPKGKYVLAAKVTEAKEDNLETPMEEDDPNEPGDKLNDSVNSVLATPLGKKNIVFNFMFFWINFIYNFQCFYFLYFFQILIIFSRTRLRRGVAKYQIGAEQPRR